ncbi:hypothetical protein GSI_12213 [Ganoderma sinense ZZ0214-1]|uniref:BTB domain-containing protein n=1 Tax=Ganoderma sinense ZZ0214-1 TaxID=1077348 RepID=A0A2G8RY66_9APHY|nr:hypothetical protein GSI_12213 [Ganoderma sinense ZZ0214-1]
MSHQDSRRRPQSSRDTQVGVENLQDLVDGLTRSEDFWIPDGNIVLVAGETAFRVYQGLLTLQSTVFADMFASSSPRTEECYDGCPVIRLQDSPRDLVHLLRVLLPTSYAYFNRRQDDPPIPFHEISAIVRLAHKYHIEGLLNRALSTLQDSIATRFEFWEDKSYTCPVYIDRHAVIPVVNLARLTDTPSLLPLALYKCCELGGSVLDGWKREDGTIEYLSHSDLKRCIDGRNNLAREAFAIVSTIFAPSASEECQTPDDCVTSVRIALSDILDYDGVADPSVLDNWDDVIHLNARSQGRFGYCSACEKELVSRDRQYREYIWNSLPQIFDVDVKNWNRDPDEMDHDGGNGEDAGN